MTIGEWIDQGWLTEVEFLQYMSRFKPSDGTTPTVPKIAKKVFNNEILGSAIVTDTYQVPGGKIWFNINVYTRIWWGGASAYVSPILFLRPADADQRFLGAATPLFSRIYMAGTTPWATMYSHASQNIDERLEMDYSAAGGEIDFLVPIPKVTLKEGDQIQITMEGGALDYFDYLIILSEMDA